MFKTNNSLNVFVGSFFDPAGSDALTASSAADGDIIVARPDGTAFDSVANKLGGTSSDTKFKVGHKDADGSVRWSPVIDIANITSATAVKNDGGIAHTEQVASVGYSSAQTGASIQAIDNNRYTLRVQFKHDVHMYSEQSDQHFFEYVSGAGATKANVADYFAQAMSKTEGFADGKATGNLFSKVSVERFGSASASAVAAGLDVVTLTRGSKVIQCSAITGSDTGIVVGNYLRIDGANGASDAVTKPLYKIAALDSTNNTITLDQPWQNASVTMDDEDLHYMTASTLNAGNVGLKIIGLPTKFAVGRLGYDVVAFDIQGDGVGTTAVAVNTASQKCTVCGRAIAELEWFGAAGGSGAIYRGLGFPNNSDLVSLYAKTTTDDLYDFVHIAAKIDGPSNLPISGVGDPGRVDIMIAMDDGDGEGEDLMDVLQHITGLAVAGLD